MAGHAFAHRLRCLGDKNIPFTYPPQGDAQCCCFITQNSQLLIGTDTFGHAQHHPQAPQCNTHLM